MATQALEKDTVEDCIESLRIIASDTGLGGDKDKGAPKTMIKDVLKDQVCESGKDIGEAMTEEEVEKIFKNIEELMFDNEVVIELHRLKTSRLR